MSEDFLPMAFDDEPDVGGALAPFSDGGGDMKSLTAPQKAALIIAALGPEAAGPIIERITDNHLRAFTRAYANIDRIDYDQLLQVVEEFTEKLRRSQNEVKGGFEQARSLLSEFKSADEIIRLMEDIGAPGGRSVWEKLEEANEKALAKYLATQNPQTIAVVMTKLSGDKAAFVLTALPEALAREVVMKMSKPIDVGAPAMRVLTETIEAEFLAPTTSSKTERSPGRIVGSLMNSLPTERRDSLLTHMNEHAPQIMPIVQKYMLTFQDFAERVPANAVAIIVREAGEDILLKALKFGKQNAPSAVEYILENISQRMSQQYVERLDKIDKVSAKEAEASQRQIMGIVRELEGKGEIRLNEVMMDEAEETMISS
ncbi:MAG: FliG C-terminal domain-containing protein [Pseudomonadota bacterium]